MQFKFVIGEKVNHLAQRMDAGVGATGAGDTRGRP